MTIEFAQIISTIDQRPNTTEAVPVFMDQNDAIGGIEHSIEHPADIVIMDSGTYVLIAAPQIGRTSGEKPAFIDFWLRRNGLDIPNSCVRAVVKTDQDKDVIVNQTMMPFNKGDVINVMMAIERTGDGLGIEAIRTPGRPLIPSIIFSIHKIKDHSEGHWVNTERGTKKVWVDG